MNPPRQDGASAAGPRECPECRDLAERRVCGMCADCWRQAQERNRRVREVVQESQGQESLVTMSYETAGQVEADERVARESQPATALAPDSDEYRELMGHMSSVPPGPEPSTAPASHEPYGYRYPGVPASTDQVIDTAPAAQGEGCVFYRLVADGEVIPEDAESLRDDCRTWGPADRWTIGRKWGNHLMPMRTSGLRNRPFQAKALDGAQPPASSQGMRPETEEWAFRDGFYAGAEYQGWSDADAAGCDMQIGKAQAEAWEKRKGKSAAQPKAEPQGMREAARKAVDEWKLWDNAGGECAPSEGWLDAMADLEDKLLAPGAALSRSQEGAAS